MECRRHGAPRRVEESAAEAVLGREPDRVDDAVETAERAADVVGDGLRLSDVGDVELEDLRDRVEPVRAALREAHGSSERREHHVCARRLWQAAAIANAMLFGVSTPVTRMRFPRSRSVVDLIPGLLTTDVPYKPPRGMSVVWA